MKYKKLTRELCKRFKVEWPKHKEGKRLGLAVINAMAAGKHSIDAADFASDVDRAYFEQNPAANDYIRPYIHGEHLEDGFAYIHVMQIKPGYRIRHPVNYINQPGDINIPAIGIH